MPTINRTIIAVVMLLLSARIAGAQEYKIQLARPLKVGDQYSRSITASMKQSADTTVNGQLQPAESVEFTVELKGLVTVLAVNDTTGSATKISCKIDKLTRDSQDVYPAGTVITAEKTGPTITFLVDGKPPAAANQETLDTVLQISDAKKTATNDELTGTPKPQKVGGTWPIDNTKLAKEIAGSGLPVEPANTKGHGTLVKVEKANDIDVMTIQTTVTSDGFKKLLDDGSSITGGQLKIDVTSIMAVDPAVTGGISITKMHCTMTVRLPGGAGQSLVTIDRKSNEENRPVKP